MSFLKNILEEKRFEEELSNLQEEYDELYQKFQELISEHNVQISEDSLESINEGITDFDPNMSTGEMFDVAQRRFNAAKWAMGLTNKLRNPEDKKKHRRIVLTAMNKIRAIVNRLMMQLTNEVKSGEDGNIDSNTRADQRKMETRPRMAS